MLQHRLPLDAPDLCNWTAAPLPGGMAAIPRVKCRAAFAVMAVYEALCAVLYVSGSGVAQLAPRYAGPTAAIIAFTAITMSAGALSAWATGLHAKTTLMKAKSLPGLAVLAATASSMPLLLVMTASAATTQNSLLPPAMRAASLVLSVAAGHVAWRLWLDRLLRRGYCLDRVIVLAESAAEARMFAALLERRSSGRLRATASFAISDAASAACFSSMQKAVRMADTDQIIIVESSQARPQDRSTIFQLVRSGADVTVVPQFGPAYRVGPRSNLLPDLPPIDAMLPPLCGAQAAVKRGLDIVAALTALLVTLPLILLIAIAIKSDSRGPVFFRQKRYGARGEIFRIWKFRTMVVDAPSQGARLQTRRGDPRITAVGRFLRRTSLDELPQIANVLSGEMSIVGPRPHAVGMLVAGSFPETILQGYELRHCMKPGITGWAQVHGSRGEIDSARALRRRFALDRHYVENWSVRMDIMIILRTLVIPFADRHAF